MSDVLKATIPAAVADNIGAAVSLFLSGRIDLGGKMTMVIPEEIGWTMRRLGGFARVTPSTDVLIERPGFDVFLDHVDLFPNGNSRVEVKRFGISIEREFPAPTAPMAGALGLLSAPVEPAPILTWLVTSETPDWLARVRIEAQDAGIDPDIAAKAVQAVRTAFPLAPSGHRRVRKPTRREAVRVGVAAAGIPQRWLTLWWLASWFVPAPIRAVIEAVIWALDTFVETTP